MSNTYTKELNWQNQLLEEYINKYFSPNKIEELVGEFSFSADLE